MLSPVGAADHYRLSPPIQSHRVHLGDKSLDELPCIRKVARRQQVLPIVRIGNTPTNEFFCVHRSSMICYVFETVHLD